MLTFDTYAEDYTRRHGGELRYVPTFGRAWLRVAYGVARLAARFRVSPMTVTTIGLVVVLLVPVVAALGGAFPILAAAFVAVAVLADTVDGPLAALRSRTTPLGGLYDALVDRIGEMAFLVSLWVVGAPGWLAALCAAMTWVHEYVRTRSGAAGLPLGQVATAGDRPVRVALTVAGLVLSGLLGPLSATLAAGPVTVAAGAWVVFSGLGLVQLLGAVRRNAARLQRQPST